MSQELANEAAGAIANFARDAYGTRIVVTVIVTVDDGNGGAFLNGASNARCPVCHARAFAAAQEAEHGHGFEGTPVPRRN